MMALTGVLFEIDFVIDKISTSRKTVLDALAQRIGLLRPGTSTRDIYDCFLARERLGSTSVGAGIAAPRAVLDETCTPLIQVTLLWSAVSFDVADDIAVDLLLCVVGNRHDLRWLQIVLPRFARLASMSELASRIRSAKDVAEVENVLALVGIYADRTLSKKAA